MPVSKIVKNAVPDTKQSWFDANGSVPAPIAGTMEAIVPAMYQLWGAYGYQPAITWYQLANMYVSWEYTATEKIARTIASLPPKLFRYENAAGKTLKPYYVKGLLHNDMMTKNYSSVFLARKLKKDHGIRRVEIDDHPFLDLINAPNEDMVRYNFWRMLAIHLELNGAVGIYKAKPDAFGNPQALHVLPATWTGQFKPVPETNGTRLIKGYRLLDQNINTDFTTEEIIWIHYTSLRNPFEGMSALKAQLYAFNMDQYLAQQITAFYKNGAMFSNIFTTEQQLTQKQYDQLALQLQQYQGAKNAGQKFILHSGLKMEKPLTSTAREAMIDEIERMARDKILSAHDMSAGKIGLTEHQNRSNLEVVDMGFFNEAIKPRAMLITEYFDQYLVHQYDPALDFEFDYPHYNDRDMDLKERTANINAGVTTRNEERDKMGLEPVDGGDVILVSPMNVPLSSVANPPEPPPPPVLEPKPNTESEPPPPVPKEPAVKSWTSGSKTAAWKAFDSEATAYEPLFKRAVVKFLRDTSKDIIDRLEKHGVKIKSNIGAMNLNGRQKWLADHKARLDEFIPPKKEMQARLEKEIKPAYLAVLKERGDRKMKELDTLSSGTAKGRKDIEADVELEFDLNDPEVLDWLGVKLDKLGTEVTTTTVDNIKEILRDDFEAGEPLMKMGEHLRDYFTGAETYRANLIARTESTASMNEADLESVRQMDMEDVVAKVWLAEQDDSTRETHREAGERYSDGRDSEDGQPMRIDDEFEVGDDRMTAPGGGTLAAENCNCRCGLVYEVIAESEEKALKDHGNWGHAGRQGERGGSMARGEGIEAVYDKRSKTWKDKSGDPLPEHIPRIPPAWVDVKVNRDPDADLLVVGKDSKDRRQAIYSDKFLQQNADAKFARIDELDKKYDGILKEVKDDIHAGRNVEEASCESLIMTTGIRPGSERDRGGEKQAYGATTLLGQHVVGNEDNLHLQFTGKKGVDLDIPVSDKETARDLIERRSAAGKDGKIFNTDNEKLGDYTKARDGGGFKTKDFRTLLGTRTARETMKGMSKPTNEKEYKRSVRAVAKSVSAKLGNTPTVALQSYIHPGVFADWRLR